MGQYWYVVNLDKKEFVTPHKLGCGLKLWEQLANHPSTGSALLVLCAAMSEARGGGDFDLDSNWHGPERTFPEHNITPASMPEEYSVIAHRTIGRWTGDRIALIGDYAEDEDLPKEFHASKIYENCQPEEKQVYTEESVGEETNLEIQDMTEGIHYGMYYHFEETSPSKYKDVTDDVARVIEHELNGKFVGTGRKTWQPESEVTR